jgi:hypothetical protein
MSLGEGFRLPESFRVHPFGDRPGWGEDNPVWASRLARDGWVRVSEGNIAREDFNAAVWLEFDPPIVWERAHPIVPERFKLKMTIRGVSERNGPWYLTEHSILSDTGESYPLGRTDWADWSHSGDLLFSKSSALYRLPYKQGVLAPLATASEIANLASATFTPREAPADLRHWPKR